MLVYLASVHHSSFALVANEKKILLLLKLQSFVLFEPQVFWTDKYWRISLTINISPPPTKDNNNIGNNISSMPDPISTTTATTTIISAQRGTMRSLSPVEIAAKAPLKLCSVLL